MKKSITLCCIAAMLFAVLVITNSLFAQSATTTASGSFSLQGMLTGSTGTPISDGTHSLTANVYAAGSGQLVYTETDNITTAGGLFTTMIGGNGSAGSHLIVKADSGYELGVAIDGQAELAPKISLASSINSLTANLAANADAVDGFSVAASTGSKANSLLVLNGSGKIDTSVLSGSLVTSVNGASGAVTIQGGGNLGVATNGNTISLSFTGGGGGLNLPFSQTVNLASGTAFSITNTLGGSAASFVNTGLGAALNASSMTGSAINATSTGSVTGAATIDVSNTGGTAINAVSTASGNAVLTLKNLSSDASAQLLVAANAAGSPVLNVMANGQTTIASSVGNALSVSTSAVGQAALALNGGLKITGGAVGTGQINIGQTQTTINNALVKGNSIIMLTVTGAGGVSVPLQVLSQADGSFVVSVLTGVAAVTGNATFSYLIINQ
ncbi:MAG: hypothetical protein Q8916_03020 [Bacteroidota bacterium]|nr:hypothetical protein [Bacteroidota bacterium]MDP4229359.1 hypothetical protein [Bacteroidota bacterium]MDP4236353.1 hypothetical protein [Bacteroidota bacterium]